MQNFDIVKETHAEESFRVNTIVGKYDLPSIEIKERFVGSLDLPKDWSIGLIVGGSGTGKTTILNNLFGESVFGEFEYKAKSVVDDMPQNSSMEEIGKTFNSVGFSSPPSWLKPYNVLSNGEKMRVDLARSLLLDVPMFAFDEFTSVVDRNVAKIGSYAMQKAIRRTNKRFIACTCHYDVEEWLCPDWVFDTNKMKFQKKNLKIDPTYKSKSLSWTTKLNMNFGECLQNTTI